MAYVDAGVRRARHRARPRRARLAHSRIRRLPSLLLEKEVRPWPTRNELKYTAEHEWVAVDGDVATVGITAYAADKLGDVVFVDLPKVGSTVAAGKVVGEIESTKSVGELFAPVDGEVVEANDAVVDRPEPGQLRPVRRRLAHQGARSPTLPELLTADEYADADRRVR